MPRDYLFQVVWEGPDHYILIKGYYTEQDARCILPDIAEGYTLAVSGIDLFLPGINGTIEEIV